MYATGTSSKEAGAMTLHLQKSRNSIMAWFAPTMTLGTHGRSHIICTTSFKISNVPVYFANQWEVDHSARWVEIHVGGYIPQVMRRSNHLHRKQHYENNPKLPILVVKGIYWHPMWAYLHERVSGNTPRRTWMNSINPNRIILAAVSKQIHFRHISSGIGLFPFEKTMTLSTLSRAMHQRWRCWPEQRLGGAPHTIQRWSLDIGIQGTPICWSLMDLCTYRERRCVWETGV